MKEIVLSHKYWMKLAKLGWHTSLYETIPGLPEYAGEDNGDAINFVNVSNGDASMQVVSRVVKKDNCAVMYFGGAIPPDEIEKKPKRRVYKK